MEVERTAHLFTVELLEDGTYMAIRDQSPLFALHGESIEEVSLKAQKAFDSYKQLVYK